MNDILERMQKDFNDFIKEADKLIENYKKEDDKKEDDKKEEQLLQEQIKDANRLIKMAAPLFSYGSIHIDRQFSPFQQYLTKWGVE